VIQVTLRCELLASRLGNDGMVNAPPFFSAIGVGVSTFKSPLLNYPFSGRGTETSHFLAVNAVENRGGGSAGCEPEKQRIQLSTIKTAFLATIGPTFVVGYIPLCPEALHIGRE
jgi:hypothetical protein